MAITVEEIFQLYKERVIAQGPVLNQMRKVRDHANGDIIVPLNELDRNAVSSVASLLTQGLDQMSTRVASTMPMPYFPPLKDGQQRSMDLARDRKRALLNIWDANRMSMKMRRRSRHLLAYSSSPVLIKPDFRTLTPKWHVRNPLDTFPSFRDDPDDPVPDNCIFTYTKPYKWLIDNYGDKVIGQLRIGKASWDAVFTILEYVDDTQIVMAVVDRKRKTGNQEPNTRAKK